MPEGKHSLPDGYDRLDGQITGPVLDSIVIHPRSHGRLHMPGEYRTDKRSPGHQVKVTSTDTENQGVYTGERLLGGPERYAVSYDVWNHRDSPSFAEIILTGQADQVQENTLGG